MSQAKQVDDFSTSNRKLAQLLERMAQRMEGRGDRVGAMWVSLAASRIRFLSGTEKRVRERA